MLRNSSSSKMTEVAQVTEPLCSIAIAHTHQRAQQYVVMWTLFWSPRVSFFSPEIIYSLHFFKMLLPFFFAFLAQSRSGPPHYNFEVRLALKVEKGTSWEACGAHSLEDINEKKKTITNLAFKPALIYNHCVESPTTTSLQKSSNPISKEKEHESIHPKHTSANSFESGDEPISPEGPQTITSPYSTHTHTLQNQVHIKKGS